MFWISKPGRCNGSSVLQNVQTGSGTHPASYTMDNGGVFFGVKRADREIDCSPLYSAEARNEWSNTSTSPLLLHGFARQFHL
jgi:hypothetical protein